MTQEQIKYIQARVGATPDGFWGPKSEAACRIYLCSLMPTPNPWPTQDRVTEFYGPHGTASFTPPTKEIVLPFAVAYEGVAVTKLRPHVKCADSLLRIFEDLARVFPTQPLRNAAGILTYDGLYNPRPMRGGSAWSMHSWAIAIDLDADFNGNLIHWPTHARMPLEVMECFAREGWTSAGAFWSRDAMHFQATQP